MKTTPTAPLFPFSVLAGLALSFGLMVSTASAQPAAPTAPPQGGGAPAQRGFGRGAPVDPSVLNEAIPDLPPPPRSNTEPHVNTAIMPYPQYYDDALQVSRGNIRTFNQVHAANVARAKQGGIDVMFEGDSITQFWNQAGQSVWAANFGAPKYANFGISADRTQNVLWRLANGEGEGFNPKVVVLMIGTNNLGLEVDAKTFRNTGAEIADGVKAIIADLEKRFPGVKILLFAVLPRGPLDNEVTDPKMANMRQYVQEVNAIISKYDDGKQVFYVDLGPQFLDATGHIPRELMNDTALIHPSAEGYRIWADAINKKLVEWGLKTPQEVAAVAQPLPADMKSINSELKSLIEDADPAAKTVLEKYPNFAPLPPPR